MPRLPAFVSSVLSLLAAASLVSAATVDIAWPTKSASPPPSLPAGQAEWLPAFRTALTLLPESVIVSMALGQPQILGIPPEESRKLGPLVAAQYELIAADPELSGIRSHLTYCFSETRPTEGLARLSHPAKTDRNTPVLVFLHGSGGSFLWYHRWIRATFPDHIVISPAYGTNTAAIPAAYLRECQEQAARTLGHSLSRPVIVGLSAGGFGASRAYAANPTAYRSAIVLAAYPPPEILNANLARMDFRFLAGDAEYHVRDGTWSQALGRLRQRGATVGSRTLSEAGHFFLLTHETETRGWLSAQLTPPTK